MHLGVCRKASHPHRLLDTMSCCSPQRRLQLVFAIGGGGEWRCEKPWHSTGRGLSVVFGVVLRLVEREAEA